MNNQYNTIKLDNIVEEINEEGSLVLNFKRVKKLGFCSTADILSYDELPLTTKYRLYMAYLEDGEESPLSYLDADQHCAFWDIMNFENLCDGDINRLRQSYDRLMNFLKPHLDNDVEEAYEDSAIEIAEREAGVCGDEFAEEYALDCKNRALDMQRSQS